MVNATVDNSKYEVVPSVMELKKEKRDIKGRPTLNYEYTGRNVQVRVKVIEIHFDRNKNELSVGKDMNVDIRVRDESKPDTLKDGFVSQIRLSFDPKRIDKDSLQKLIDIAKKEDYRKIITVKGTLREYGASGTAVEPYIEVDRIE